MLPAPRTFVVALAAAVLVSSVAAPAAAASTGEPSATNGAYAGTHVSFETSSTAVTAYTIGDVEMLTSVETEARDDYQSRVGADVGANVELSTVTEVDAAGVSLTASSETRATVETESGAELDAHDNERGILQVRAADGAQVVKAELGSGGEAEAESDDRVVVTTAEGETATFVVVGDGAVAVNEEGDVVADLDEDARLVVRSYVDDDRDDDDRESEQLIADGEAVAEVYVEERDGERAADAVTYAADTTVETRQSAENEVEVTVERTASEGKVVITTISESVIGAVEDVEVRVDGEVAAEASSYSELRAAADGEESKYMVRQAGSAEGSAEVLVALNHFSERVVTVEGGDDTTPTGDGSGSGDDGTSGADGDDDTSGDDGSTSGSAPGFGVGAALVALFGAVLLARRRA
jgi:PGF-CTERM protein